MDRGQRGGYAVRGVHLPAGAAALLAVGTLVIAVDRRATGPALPCGRGSQRRAPEDAEVTVWLVSPGGPGDAGGGQGGLREVWRRHYRQAASACGPTTLAALERLLAEHPPPAAGGAGEGGGPGVEVRRPAAGRCRWCGEPVREHAGHQAVAVEPGGVSGEGVEHWLTCPPRRARDGAVCAVCGRTVVGSDAGEYLVRGPGGPAGAVWETRHPPARRCADQRVRSWAEFEAERARTAQAEAIAQSDTRLRMEEYRAQRAAEEAAAAAEDEAVAAFLGAAVGVREDQAPVRVLGKALRDGRRFALYLVPGSVSDQPQLLALIAGAVAAGPFWATVQRFGSPVPGVPHTLAVPLTGPGRPPGRTLVGLTGAEADTISRAGGAWRRRYTAALRAATPGAPTWRITRRPPVRGRGRH
ncbi:hypothetical protein [Streptomyces sp. NPDC094031]|uniref:hypothetical protein n=1 Tax=Streptomyces sp. NPDC094031 TaxID=3155307 RepID=UPI00332BC3A2